MQSYAVLCHNLSVMRSDTIEREELNTNKCDQCGITCEDVWQEYLADCKKWNRPVEQTREDFNDFVDGGGGACTESVSCDWGPICEGCREHQEDYL